MSYFLYGVAYILWDNIARGTQISCPHIEKSCTAAYYSDRKLGVSETVCTAASTIHFFTGNNIGAKGDLASRSLHIRLDVDRVDPENRPFKHPDPIGWTENHRAEILAALYTILLGNPAAQGAARRGGQDQIQDVVATGRLGGRDMPPGWPGRSSTSRNCSSRKRRTTRNSASLADVLDVLVKNMAETVHGERCGGDDQQPVSRARTNRRCATFCCPGAPAAPRVLGKIHRPAAENDTSTSRSAVASARLSCVRGRISTARCASMAS